MAVLAVSVEEIAAMRDPVLRNLLITQRYHELAVRLRDRGLQDDATWCAFAVWASKTAGVTIRGEELPARVGELLDAGNTSHGVLHRFHHALEQQLAARLDRTLLLRAVADVSGLVSSSIASGNVLVFSELAPLFTVLAEADDPAPGIEAGLAALRASDVGVDTAPVRAAFAAYLKALGQPPDRAELVLAGNILAVAHEQQRLQDAIATALDVGVSGTAAERVEKEVSRSVPLAEVRAVFDRLMGDVLGALEGAWQRALTEILLRLETADETLELHRDVPPLQGTLFPPVLGELEGSAAAEPYAQWDRTGGSGRPTGAHDWAVIGDRMNYIVTLFRSRQRHPALFTPPFSDAQLAALADGRLPAGPL